MPAPLHIAPGDRYGRLVIMREAPRRKRRRYFVCRCDCGAEKVVRLGTLRRGETKSCGCKKRDHLRSINTTHGQARTRLYYIWQAMKSRCLTPTIPNYRHYGARGVRVCDEWLEFEPFQEWAHANGYGDDLTIERIDNDGDYQPANCTWIPQSEQSSNTRRARQLSYRGRTQSMRDWAAERGMKYATLESRLRKGWPVARALTTPVRGRS